MADSQNRLGSLALADLARAVAQITSQSRPHVKFRVEHVGGHLDRFVTLMEESADSLALEGAVDAQETVSFVANGVGVTILTGDNRAEGRVHHSPGEPVIKVDSADAESKRIFRGTARPNPSFLYESRSTLQGLVVMEDEPHQLLYRHAVSLRLLLQFVADCAATYAESPILSLQCPSQAPPHSTDKDRLRTRVDEWPRSACFALRFSIALQDASAEVRLNLTERIADYCENMGFGFWVADTRAGYRPGNWFLVVPHNRSRARDSHPVLVDRGGDKEVKVVVPVTFVGPARIGSSSAILDYLSSHASLGIASCSVTSLDDLALIHLQLVVNYARASKVDVYSRKLDRKVSTDGVGEGSGTGAVAPSEFIDSASPLLTGGIEPQRTREEHTRIVDIAGDYQTLAGPAFRVCADIDKRVPIWLSWRIAGEQPRLRPVILALRDALGELNLHVAQDRWHGMERESSARPDPLAGADAVGALVTTPESDFVRFDYVICRSVGSSVLRGKAKLSVRESGLPGWIRSSGRLSRGASVGWEIQQRWRRSTDVLPWNVQVSAGDREYRVGHEIGST